MVDRPATTPDWATDAGRRLEPATAEKATGFEEGTRSPARKVNWLTGFLADWANYLAAIITSDEEHVYQSPKSRTVEIWPTAGTTGAWVLDQIVVSGTVPTLLSQENGGHTYFPLAYFVPTGAVITAIEVLLTAGTNTRDPGDRASIGIGVLDNDWDTPDTEDNAGVVGFTEADGTVGLQLIQSTGLSYSVDHGGGGSIGAIRVTSGDDGGAHNSDRLWGVRVTFDDPGPRNF